jgi:outer membrane protein assembly factor BamB
MRRAWVGFVGVALLAALGFLPGDNVQGQVKVGGMAGGPGAPTKPGVVHDLADRGRLTLPTDPKLKNKLNAVKDYIQSEDWKTVADNVQVLLNLDKDVFVQIPVKQADGKEVETLVGIRIAANRLLAGLPRDKPGVGLDVYNSFHGPTARKLLAEAITDGDRQKFADIAQRFLWTEAGGAAAERLATILLDRGDFMAAAQAFDRLIQRDGIEKLEPLTLYKAAIAFHKGNSKEDKANLEKVWKQLLTKSPDGLSIGGQTVALEDARKYLDRIRSGVNTSIHDWPMVGGNPSRSGQGVGDVPFMLPVWNETLFDLKSTGQAKAWISTDPNSAVKKLESRGEAIIPAFAPVTATVTAADGRQRTLLIYRDYENIVARDLRTGKHEWHCPSSWSLELMLKNGQAADTLKNWVTQFKDGTAPRPGVLLENSTVGTMSSDGIRAYAVDDLQVPPFFFQQVNQWGGMPPNAGANFNAAVNPAVQANALQAFSIANGKLLWKIDGRAREGGDEDQAAGLKHDFRDSHFLGAPLCLGGKLYFLNEKNQEIRLLCLDTGKLPSSNPSARDLDEAILWEQPLGTAKEKLLADFGRRIHAAHIAYGEGILVCPTNAGVVLGVELLTHNLVWAHPYSDTPVTPQPNPNDPWGGMRRFPGGQVPNPGANAAIAVDWKAAPPVIADGRVVFTAPDGPELRCLSLRNGDQVWGIKRSDGDVYFAGVYAGRVIVVGKKDVRALSLDDARELWRVPTGMPSGRGIASNNIYYLPLKKAVFTDKEEGPGIFAIDIEHGKVVAQTRSKKDPKTNTADVPGNLTFFDGQVVSQSATEVVVYPQLKVQLDRMNELLAKNANDPEGLFKRGELRLDKGERAGAVEDLRAALANNPAPELKPKAEAKLFDAMTELLQHDFSSGEKYLEEYRELCNRAPESPEKAKEVQRRKANFLCLVAKGREAQGRLGEALTSYLEFGSLPTAQDELLGSVDEPAVQARPDVWARGRIKAMMDHASLEQRRPLVDVIAGKWDEVRGSGDLEKLRHFVGMFGSTAAIGKEGRLFLAERLMERSGKADLLDSELEFTKLLNDEDPAFVARALDGLARLTTSKGELENAYKYYKDLKIRFPNTPVRDGKTGTQLLDELATDKRFLQYMDDESGQAVGKPHFKAVLERDKNFQPGSQHMVFTFDALGDPLPSMKQLRFAVNHSTNHLKLVDRRTGKEEMSEPINEQFGNYMYPQQQQMMNPAFVMNMNQQPLPSNRFSYHPVGHLAVANLGQWLVGVDTVTHSVKWQKNLFGSYNPGTSLSYNAAEETLESLFTDGTRMTIAQSGPVESTYVCYQTREGLYAIDPFTGKTLWTRSDVTTRCRLFGDDRHIYLVELDNNNTAATTRCFRAEDGVSVPVPSFATLYQKRQRVAGRELLLSENVTGGVALRLYDVQTGKDLWSQTFPANSVVLRSEDPDLAGAVSPDGKATFVSLSRRKVVGVGILNPEHLKHQKEIHLLADARNFYVMIHATDPANPNDQIYPNLQPNTGLRGITVNGEVYAFERRTSKTAWHNEVKNQQLSLEEWREMPVLMFTSRYQPGNNGNGMVVWRGGVPQNQNFGEVYLQVYGKATGRLEFRQPSPGQVTMGQNYGQVYAINNDVRDGKIEMIANNYKLTIAQEGAAETASRPAAQAPAPGPKTEVIKK